MSRTLLLCHIHGFKGSDDSFGTFPEDLKKHLSSQLSDHNVESVVYPKYATKGELTEASVNFLEWLKERVMDVRKAKLEKPWPPNDKNVGVILIAHSMGGFVATEALFHILNERATSDDPKAPLFPMIQGILAFDTPFNGLARSMFVYGGFSNYQKVSSVFNVMTALSAAPASISTALKRGAGSVPGANRTTSPAAWKTWQLVAVRTGTVGAIAAGGVAAYIHRQKIMDGVQGMRNLKKQDIVEGYQQGVDRLGQGLAYVNKGNVGQSFAWLSDHLTFVGVLMKQQELNKRLERLANLKGIGIHDIYCSMGENGYWSGGYFVPERTFCAVPADDQPASNLFSRHVVENAEDEIQAHMSLFKTDKNEDYKLMIDKATKLVITWFNDDSEIVDNPEITKPSPADSAENAIKATDEGVEVEGEKGTTTENAADTQASEDSDGMPDESPLDIAAAASLVPLPTDGGDDAAAAEGVEASVPEVKDKQSYYRYLMGIAQSTGTGISQASSGVKGYIPTKLPSMPTMPSMSMPSVSVPSVSVPGAGFFSKKQASTASEESAAAAPTSTATQPAENVETKEEPKTAEGTNLPKGEVQEKASAA
ncbi:hypothetical protein KVR01_009285 [Diaporthe batatas]|uniref:uncharacterized protein n=1 Tax=Diaporthe batatas TaxID=748121 RepID=UPI001D0510C2|nr:uncharacterized protein KVR01_009285 [Diaporthe batatas]KAG8161021.1 hypothetical protein KVR01_009285 [Diaporthe batatas]